MDREAVAELWFYPDGTRILELSVEMHARRSISAGRRDACRAYAARHHAHRRAADQDAQGLAATFRASTATTAINKASHVSGRMRLSIIVLLSVGADLQRGQRRSRPESLQIYVVDVEGGKAMLVVSPSGESLLVDTGNIGEGAQP